MFSNRLALAFHGSVLESSTAHPHGWQLHVYTPEEYAAMRLWMLPDGLGGAAVTPDGELVSVHHHPDSMESMSAILHQVTQVASYLDCFDVNDFLPALYRGYGWTEYDRVRFDHGFAPRLWTPDKGTPDVVYMRSDECGPDCWHRK